MAQTPMKITAMLSWFDEPCDLLRQAVRSAAVIADRIVAADGAYELIHDRKPISPKAQKRAIADEARKNGLKCSFLTPRLWRGQVEKRNAVLQEACKGSDWVMILDADWKITGNRKEIREEIRCSDAEQILVNFIQTENHSRPIEESAPNVWHVSEAGIHRRHPLIFRAMEDMRCENHHWIYSGVRPSGVRIGLWGGEGTYDRAKTDILEAEHCFEHLCLFRDEKRIVRNRLFCHARDADVAAFGVER